MRRSAVAALSVVLLAACGGARTDVQKTADRRASQARDVARNAGLSPSIQDFLAHYASAVGETFSVTYAVSASSGVDRIVVDQRPPERRVDLRGLPGGVDRSQFELSSGTYACARAGGAWTCQRSSSKPVTMGALSAADIDETVQQLKASRDGFTFRVGTRRLAGTKAACLVTTPRAATSGGRPGATPKSLCLSPEGAPLLLESAGQTLRAVRYGTRVDRARLRLPAPPSSQ